MKMNVTRWSPDTCKCVFEYEWDSDLSADSRVHTLKNVVNACSEHQILKNNSANHYAGVLDENVRKNKVHGQLLTVSSLSEIFTNEDGSESLVFKKGIGFNFSWTGLNENRVLNISIFGINLTNQQKTSVQAWCNTNLGVGKVVIV